MLSDEISSGVETPARIVMDHNLDATDKSKAAAQNGDLEIAAHLLMRAGGDLSRFFNAASNNKGARDSRV